MPAAVSLHALSFVSASDKKTTSPDLLSDGADFAGVFAEGETALDAAIGDDDSSGGDTEQDLDQLTEGESSEASTLVSPLPVTLTAPLLDAASMSPSKLDGLSRVSTAGGSMSIPAEFIQAAPFTTAFDASTKVALQGQASGVPISNAVAMGLGPEMSRSSDTLSVQVAKSSGHPDVAGGPIVSHANLALEHESSARAPRSGEKGALPGELGAIPDITKPAANSATNAVRASDPKAESGALQQPPMTALANGLFAKTVGKTGQAEPVIGRVGDVSPRDSRFGAQLGYRDNTKVDGPARSRSAVDSSRADGATKTPDSQVTLDAQVKPVVLDQLPSIFASTPVLAAEASVQLQTGTATGMPASSPEAARQVAAQMAVAVSRQPDGVTELLLNPEELGRVQLRINMQDGGVTMHIVADRPETADLMRRHIDQLAQEFRALGYSSIAFDFGDHPGRDSPQGDTPIDINAAAPDNLAGVDELTTDLPQRPQTGALDLRL